MAVAALVVWIVVAVGGSSLLTRRVGGGAWWATGPAAGLAPGAVLGHVVLAVSGLVVWIIYLSTHARPSAWLALFLLVLAVLRGLSLFRQWRAGREASSVESAFLPGLVYGHGLFAVITVVLVVLAAIGVGG